jgi:hypothetical protein
VGEGTALAAKSLGLQVIGVAESSTFVNLESIYRVRALPQKPNKYNYLIVSENFNDLSRTDILTIKDFRVAKERLRKKTKGSGAGIEITIDRVRKMDAVGVSRWIADAHELYEFCLSSGFQFILSSGANSPTATVSGESFDSLLSLIGIDVARYWRDLNQWLEYRLERRVHAC